VICGVVIGLLLFLFAWFLAPAWVFPLFQMTERSASIAVVMMIQQAVIRPFRDFNSVNITGVLRGGGDVRMAALVDICPLWLAGIPYAALCGLVLKTSVFWVYLAFALEQAVKFFLGIRRLRSGRWVRDLTRA